MKARFQVDGVVKSYLWSINCVHSIPDALIVQNLCIFLLFTYNFTLKYVIIAIKPIKNLNNPVRILAASGNSTNITYFVIMLQITVMNNNYSHFTLI